MKSKNGNVLDVIDFNLWDYVQNEPFVLIYFINNEVVNKSRNLQTIEEKEKVQQILKENYFIISVLSYREYNYTLYCSTAKNV